MDACMLSLQSCPTLCDPQGTVTHQTPVSMRFSRQKYWSGLPFPSLGYLPYPGIELISLMSLALADQLFSTSTAWGALSFVGFTKMLFQ